ncbi:MAG: hypothetical protein ACKVJN_14735, partial [Woeseiales bacterium]
LESPTTFRRAKSTTDDANVRSVVRIRIAVSGLMIDQYMPTRSSLSNRRMSKAATRQRENNSGQVTISLYEDFPEYALY